MSRFPPSSLNFKTCNSSFGTIFQNQGPFAPIQEQCLIPCTHYTLLKARNCIGIELYKKLKLGFGEVSISFIANQIGLPTFKTTKFSILFNFLKNQLSYFKNLPNLEKKLFMGLDSILVIVKGSSHYFLLVLFPSTKDQVHVWVKRT
jgi:hypothetical protein